MEFEFAASIRASGQQHTSEEATASASFPMEGPDGVQRLMKLSHLVTEVDRTEINAGSLSSIPER